MNSAEAPTAIEVTRWRPSRFFFDVEPASQLFQEEGVVLLVLWPKNVSVSDGSGIFPIDIQAIELVVAHKLDSAVDKCLPAGGSQHHIRESS